MNMPEKALEIKALIVAAVAFVTGFLGWLRQSSTGARSMA